MSNRFSSGRHTIAQCDRCGQRFKLRELKKFVVKTKQINYLVCSACWDPDHPQLQLGMYPVNDAQALRDPRPDRSYVSSGLLNNGLSGEGSRNIQWGWNPVGGSSLFDARSTPNYLVANSQVGTVTVENIPLPADLVNDPYYYYVSLLCHADNSAVPTNFIDNSPFPVTISSGGAFQTTPAKFGAASGLFQYQRYAISYLDSGRFTFGSLPFTVETWVYALNPSITGGASYATLIGQGAAGGWELRLVDRSGGGYTIQLYVSETSNGSISTTITATSNILINSWVFVAAVRDGNVLRLFINGVQEATATFTGSIYANASVTISYGCTNTVISGFSSTYNYFRGYLDDMRITKGIARYTNTVTPPGLLPPIAAFPNTGPVPRFTSGALVGSGAIVVGSARFTNHVASGALVGYGSIVVGGSVNGTVVIDPYYMDVTLLMHADGTSGSTTFVDNSSLSNSITAVSAVVNTSTVKFGTGSAYFDGTAGSYITVPSNAGFQFGTADFTVELWLNTTDTNFNLYGLSAAAAGNWMMMVSASNFYWQTANGVTNLFNVSATAILDGAWHHIAVTRSGTSTRVFFDGVIQGASPYTDATNYNGAGALRFSSGANGDLNGYVDDVRITKGAARYTANFSLPTAAFPNVGPTDPAYSNVSLLLHADGVNGSYSFIDNSPLVNTVTVTNTYTNKIYVSTSEPKFGTGSAYILPTNQSYIRVEPTTALAFGTGDFTVEAWVKTSYTSFWLILLEAFPGFHNNWAITVTDSQLSWRWFPTASYFTVPCSAILNNQWHHIAVSRSGAFTRIFFDGVLQGAAFPDSANYAYNASYYLRIGNTYYDNVGSQFNGFVDDLRITKGVARYTATFTPPAAPFPNS